MSLLLPDTGESSPDEVELCRRYERFLAQQPFPTTSAELWVAVKRSRSNRPIPYGTPAKSTKVGTLCAFLPKRVRRLRRKSTAFSENVAVFFGNTATFF